MARHHRRNTQNNMDRATEFLTGKPGLDFCDECVREALGTTRANLTEKDLHTNAVTVGLRRAPGLCSSCGKQRIVTRTVRFRQACVSGGRFILGGELGSLSPVFGKQGIHIIADTVPEVVADGTTLSSRAIRGLRLLADSWAMIFRACSNMRTRALK
jgi:hypothetical protein